MRHRTVRGRLRYTSKKADMLDQERGREWFAFTHHGDGAVTLRAQCEIEEPEPTVLRDIVYDIGPDRRPRNLHVHLVVGDVFLGSGWFRISQGLIECESDSPALGRLSQRVVYDGDLDGFGTHPIVGDGFMTRCMDVARGPHRRTIRVFVPSPDHRGATAPIASEVRIDLEYLGDERVTVVAGTFDCRKFAFVDTSEGGLGGKEHPRYEMWVTADEDSLFVQGGVGGYMATWYELVELKR